MVVFDSALDKAIFSTCKSIVADIRLRQGSCHLNNQQRSLPNTFGFISVQEIEGLGHCGGLLIVSQIGRPLEFHCSAPVARNRAQEILYGETYDSFLFCEQIGLSLVDKAKTQPQIYIANCGELLELQQLLQTPVVVLSNDKNRDYFRSTYFNSSEAGSAKRTGSIELEGQTIWHCRNNPADVESVREIVGSFTQTLALDEPFERIQKAIDEAQSVAR